MANGHSPGFRLPLAWLLLLVVSGLHLATPADTHPWHILHLGLQKLYYLPILLAASSGRAASAGGVTLATSLLYGIHLARDWAGRPMEQAAGLGEIASFCVLAVVATTLFARWDRALSETRAAHRETVDSLTAALELREVETGLHCRRVQEYSLMLAKRMELPKNVIGRLSEGALLHDVGKIGVPDRILLKPGPLSANEWEVMRSHPRLGADLLGRIGHLRTSVDVVLHHHEKYDGTGYPDGLANEDIPVEARVFAIADVFDALTTARPYHQARSFAEATAILRDGRGTHFDPAAVDAFLSIPYEEWREAADRYHLVLAAETGPVEDGPPAGTGP